MPCCTHDTERRADDTESTDKETDVGKLIGSLALFVAVKQLLVLVVRVDRKPGKAEEFKNFSFSAGDG